MNIPKSLHHVVCKAHGPCRFDTKVLHSSIDNLWQSLIKRRTSHLPFDVCEVFEEFRDICCANFAKTGTQLSTDVTADWTADEGTRNHTFFDIGRRRIGTVNAPPYFLTNNS